MKNKLIPKHLKAGKLLKNEPIQDGTYVEQPRLNLQEQELLNFIQSNPTPEQVYFRDLAIKNGESPVLQEVLEEVEKDNAKNNFFRGYNNFRYSHPWAKGLNWTPIIGDVMDGISLVGDINDKNYISAGLGLGMLALPNFIEKPIKNYKKLKKHRDNYYKAFLDPNYYMEFKYWDNLADKIALLKHPVLTSLDRLKAESLSKYYKNRVHDLTKDIQYNTLSLYKNLSKEDYARLVNIINLSPEYGIFLLQNPNLNPLSQETLDKFLERLSLSIRGVYAKTDSDALTYLNTPPLYATGGDRLGTKGLYTSNSYDIADVFSRPNSTLDTLEFNSYIGELLYPFIIDKNLTIELQLKLYRSYIDHYYDFGLSETAIPGSIAKEATYVRRNGDNYKNVIERSYYPKELVEKIANLITMHNRGPLPNLRGRWGNIDMSASDSYFIPKLPNNSLSEYITFMKAAKKEGKISTPDINLDKRKKEFENISNLFSQQRDKRDDLYQKALEKYRKARGKVNKINSSIGVTASLALPTIGLSYALHKSKLSRKAPDISKMTYEEFIKYDNLVENVNKKTGIPNDRLYKYSIERLLSLLEKNEYKKGGSLITKHKSGKQITETPRDNTNYERKTPFVKKKNKYSSYEEIVDAKVNEKLEEKKPLLKKHTRPAPAWPVGGKRKA